MDNFSNWDFSCTERLGQLRGHLVEATLIQLYSGDVSRVKLSCKVKLV